ncbi:transketolase C-terminal domain-containing protein [[Clostridium] cellulosi]
MAEIKAQRNAYGEALVELGRENGNVVVLDADLAHATMTNIFASEFPERFFNVGIAEQNLMGIACGMAQSGLTVFASTFAMFGAGRAYEIVRNSICYSKANVKIALSHSGLCVGEDGGSHQCLEDIALMRILPGMTVIVPCDWIEVKKAVKAAAAIDGPVYLRIARPPIPAITTEDTPFEIGKASVLRDGKDVCIVTMGLVAHEALKAADMFKEQGIDAAVLNMHTVKPLDKDTLFAYAEKCGRIVTAEEHLLAGGLGSAVAEAMMGKVNPKFAMVGVNDTFGRSGTPSELFAKFGIDANAIVEKCKSLF